MEERKKIMEQRIKEQKERLEQMRQQMGEGGMQYNYNLYYPDYYIDLNKSKKRRNQNTNEIPFEGEEMDVCVTCGCTIF